MCDKGFYSGFRARCYACHQGWYKDTVSSGSCTKCPRGSSTAGEGSTSVVACSCPAGKYGTNSCSKCGNGKTSTQGRNSDSNGCYDCPTGTAGSNGGKGEVVHIKATASDAAADSDDEGQAPQDADDAAVTALDTVDGTLSSSWAVAKPNTDELNNDAVGSFTAAEVAQSQS